MFSKTRRKLTLFFAGILIVFLIALNGSSYLILSSQIYGDREKEIQRLAEELAGEHSAELLNPAAKGQGDNKKVHEDGEDHSKHDVEKGSVLRPFYYVLDSTGNRVADDQPYLSDKKQIVDALKSWIPEPNEVKYIDYRADSADVIHLMFAGRAVSAGGRYVGSVYTGADISQQTEIVRQFMLILLVLSGIFFVVSVALGYFMSGRAMVPIMRSFNRQRQFVADASHELRTPLSVVQSSLEVIEAEEKDRLQPISKQVLEDTKDEVKRMSVLVAQLLSLARADSEGDRMRLETFAVEEEMEKLIRKFRPLADQKGLEFTAETEKGLKIRADREYFRRLITILIDNAIQYTPGKGSIHIAAAHKDRFAAISVADTGIGIPAEQLDHVFERFYRVDASRSRSAGNAGLGLSIAKWIAESHGGKIRVESRVGKGSTFTVLLPAAG